ncbi:uncharacterized protein [Nicotiana sylvestris]|uniref:uncharacterized protein n=1 Tax=Nicotiana sylvestris TaxID=4096 RepID=UPI00388C4BDF
MRNFEVFYMKESEPIQEMMTRFTIITNEPKSLGKVFTYEELVSKVISILTASWESKATSIKEAKELDKISLDELIGNLKTHEMRKLELRKEEQKRDKALVLKTYKEDVSDNDELDLAMFAKCKRFMKNSKNASKRKYGGKPKQIDKASYDGCYKCNKLHHMVKDFPMWKIECKNERAEKEKRKKMKEKGLNKGKILGKVFTEAMKQGFLAAYEDNGSDKDEEKEDEAISPYAMIDTHQEVETDPLVQLGMHIRRHSPFDGHHYDEWKMRMKMFLHATNFDLWIIVNHGPITPTKVDSEGNKSLKREEDYDAEDRKMIQKNAKTKDLLYGTDLEEHVKDLKNKVLELTSKNEQKPNAHGKEIMSDLQGNLEKELKEHKDCLCDVDYMNKVLQENLEKTKYELSRLRKWHRSSDALNCLNENFSTNKSVFGYRKPVPRFDPKYVKISDNKMCTHCEKAKVRGNNQD